MVEEANPEVIIARVNLFVEPDRPSAAWRSSSSTTWSAGDMMSGFIDVFFCPLLVDDLAHILLDILEKRLNGLYHVVSNHCSTV